MSNTPVKADIVELLRRFDINSIGEIEEPSGWTYSTNVGRLAHAAADEIEKLRAQIEKLKIIPVSDNPYGLKPISSHGDLYTIDQFIREVRSGNFTDYDGHGYLATEQEMSRLRYYFDLKNPRQYYKTNYPQFTHVIWFNK